MGKKRRILLSLLTVVVVGGIGCAGSRTKELAEPVYQGKPLSYWLDQKFFVGNIAPRHNMEIEQFPMLDTNAVPFLLQALQTSDGTYHGGDQKPSAEAPGWLHDRRPAPFNTQRYRENAAFMLGSDQALASPAVIQALLRTAREDGDYLARMYAIDSWVEISPKNEQSVRTLVELTRDKDQGFASTVQAELRRFDARLVGQALKDEYSKRQDKR